MAASRFNHLQGAALAAALATSAMLAGCGEHHVAPVQEASAPAPRPDVLAGAPPEPPPPPPAVVEAPPPPPPPPARPGDRDVVYDLGPVVRAHDTMAPVPNPSERPASGRPHRVWRAAPVAPAHRRAMHPRAHRAVAPAPTARPVPAGHAGGVAKPATVHAAKPAPHAVAPARAPSPAGKPTRAPREAVPLAAKPATSTTSSTRTSHGVAPAAAGKGGADRGAKLAALQTALKDQVSRLAVLNAPELKPNAPADVTLTLPADFASVVRDEAAKQGLQDAAASVNATALLSGDGYAVAPDETQSQPLTVGQPTEFHWTVTAQPGAKGPLHADVGADLLGGGDSALQLGTVSPGAKGGLHVSPRAWGAALLVLLAVIVFAWLSRGRGSAAARQRNGRVPPGPQDRPLDMTGAPMRPPAERDR